MMRWQTHQKVSEPPMHPRPGGCGGSELGEGASRRHHSPQTRSVHQPRKALGLAVNSCQPKSCSKLKRSIYTPHVTFWGSDTERSLWGPGVLGGVGWGASFTEQRRWEKENDARAHERSSRARRSPAEASL